MKLTVDVDGNPVVFERKPNFLSENGHTYYLNGRLAVTDAALATLRHKYEENINLELHGLVTDMRKALLAFYDENQDYQDQPEGLHLRAD